MHMVIQGCSVSMFHRTCENVHRGARLGGLCMPSILHMSFYFKPRGIKKYSIQYIWCNLNLPIFLLRVGLLTLIIYGACSENTLV